MSKRDCAHLGGGAVRYVAVVIVTALILTALYAVVGALALPFEITIRSRPRDTPVIAGITRVPATSTPRPTVISSTPTRTPASRIRIPEPSPTLPPAPAVPDSIRRALTEAIAMVCTSSAPEAAHCGTVTAIAGRSDVVVSAAHIFEDTDRAPRILWDNLTWSRAELLSTFERSDLVLIGIYGAPNVLRKLPLGCGACLRRGAVLYMAGYRGSEWGKITHLSARLEAVEFHPDFHSHVLFIGGYSGPGTSGGVVVDSELRLVGIIVAGVSGLTVAVPVERIPQNWRTYPWTGGSASTSPGVPSPQAPTASPGTSTALGALWELLAEWQAWTAKLQAHVKDGYAMEGWWDVMCGEYKHTAYVAQLSQRLRADNTLSATRRAAALAVAHSLYETLWAKDAYCGAPDDEDHSVIGNNEAWWKFVDEWDEFIAAWYQLCTIQACE